MNVKNRLKRMEMEIIKEDSDVCACPKETRNVVILPNVDGEPIREPAEDDKSPEFCDQCRKPILIETIIIQPALRRAINV